MDGPRAERYADLVADVRSVPLETCSADVVMAVHVLEHFYEWEVPELLAEWKRLLKPGGTLIVELPCMDKVIDYMGKCLAQNQPFWLQLSWWAMWGDPKYKDPAMCHKWGYTEKSLAFTLAKAGFESIHLEEPRYHVKQRDMRAVATKGASV